MTSIYTILFNVLFQLSLFYEEFEDNNWVITRTENIENETGK
jgi:hypothetical protein